MTYLLRSSFLQLYNLAAVNIIRSINTLENFQI